MVSLFVHAALIGSCKATILVCFVLLFKQSIELENAAVAASKNPPVLAIHILGSCVRSSRCSVLVHARERSINIFNKWHQEQEQGSIQRQPCRGALQEVIVGGVGHVVSHHRHSHVVLITRMAGVK
jgi:hypothetical protein